jgi:hypothetical protein
MLGGLLKNLHEATVSGKESQETSSVLDDVPWGADDAENGHEDGSTENVDVLWCETADIVGEWIRSSGNLVTNGGQHEAERNKEFGCATTGADPSGKDGWHVPFELTKVNLLAYECNMELNVPSLVLESRRDKDWCESTQGSNDGQGKELVSTSKSVLGETTEIRHVDGHGREETDDGIKSSQSAVGSVHVGGSKLELALDERTALLYWLEELT